VNPKALLTASGISPIDVAVALPGVDLEQVTIRPAPAWLAKLWGKTVAAMTFRTTVYIRSSVLDSDPAELGSLIVHELAHVQQWTELGVVRFLWQYVSGYLRGRLTSLSHQDAYRSIPIEIDARELANQLQGPIGPV
jgi:hypothetical protein